MMAIPIKTIMTPMTTTVSSRVNPRSVRIVFFIANFQSQNSVPTTPWPSKLSGATWPQIVTTGSEAGCLLGSTSTPAPPILGSTQELTHCSTQGQLDEGTGS